MAISKHEAKVKMMFCQDKEEPGYKTLLPSNG
jgi:hypothetical protein